MFSGRSGDTHATVRLNSPSSKRSLWPRWDEERELWTATYVLLGLPYPEAFLHRLLPGVRQMRESSTYQALLAEGREEGLREAIVRPGTKRYGVPSSEVLAVLEALDSVTPLENLLERLLEVESWEELLNSGV